MSKGLSYLVLEIEERMAELLSLNTEPGQKEQNALSLVLLEATLSVAVHGTDQIPGEFAERARSWFNARSTKSGAVRSGLQRRVWKIVVRSGKPRDRNSQRPDGGAFDQPRAEAEKLRQAAVQLEASAGSAAAIELLRSEADELDIAPETAEKYYLAERKARIERGAPGDRDFHEPESDTPDAAVPGG
jgi:hypothetical protein